MQFKSGAQAEKKSAENTPWLIIETASDQCLIAACYQGVIFEDTRYLKRMHNQQVLGMIDRVHQQMCVHFQQPDLSFAFVAYGCGPGSFTGVRIAAALAQAIALAHEAQVLRLSSLGIAAQSVLDSPATASRQLNLVRQPVVVLVRSRAQAYYAQLCLAARPAADEPLLYASAEPQLLESAAAFDEFLAQVAEQEIDSEAASLGVACQLVGERPDWLAPDQAMVPFVQYQASSAFKQAQLQLQLNLQADPSSALPQYISADSPWRPSVGQLKN